MSFENGLGSVKNIELTKNLIRVNFDGLLADVHVVGNHLVGMPLRDQIQHLEMTRDIARAFNKTYGQEVFREPEAIVTE